MSTWTVRAQPGSLDYSFDPRVSLSDPVADFDLQSDGRILISGSFTNVSGYPRRFAARINSDGSLDQSFDANLGPDEGVAKIGATASGRVLIAAGFLHVRGVPRPGIAQLKSDGTLDVSFDPAGILGQGITSFAIQRDGRIVVGGTYWAPTEGGTKPVCVRLRPDGSLDPTFNPDLPKLPWIYSTAVQSDGKILLGGTPTRFYSDNKIVRLNADGTLDQAFVSWPQNNRGVVSFAFLESGAIIAVGDIDFGIARFYPDLTQDGTFASGWGFNASAYSVAVRRNGRLIVGGYFTQFLGLPARALVSLFPDGARDSTFSVDFGREPAWVEKLLIQDDGKLLIAGGFRSVDGVSRNGFARLHMDDLVKGPPQITLPATNIIAMAGEGGAFFVGTASYVRPSFQWRLNGTTLPSGTNALLTLPNLLPLQAGNYDVIVSNPMGSITSAVARLEVWSVPSITEAPTNLIVRTGETASFTVWAEGAPLPAFQWQFNGSDIENATNSTLLLTNVNRRLAGTYSVSVSNALGRVLSPPAILTVWFAPEIIEQPLSLIVDAGEYAYLSVEVEAEPPPTYQWFFNDTELPDFVYSGIGRYPAQVADGGIYTVLISNLLGVVTSSPAMLTVRTYAPIVTNSPSSQTVAVARTVVFSAGVAAAPPATFQWRFNGADIPDAVDPTLTLLNVRFVNAGSYTLVARNDGGSAETPPALLTVVPAPTGPGDVDVDFFPGFGVSGPVNALALQRDGKIVLASHFSEADGATRNRLGRLHPDGSLDVTFDAGPEWDGDIRAMLVQPDEHIVFGRNRVVPVNRIQGSIARIDPEGNLDETFHADESLTQPVNALTLEPDGKIVAAVTVPFGTVGPYLLKLDSQGNRDASFDPILVPKRDGGTLDQSPSPSFSATRDYQGKILLGFTFGLLRFLPVGQSDLTFGNPFGFSLDYVQAYIRVAVIQSDDRILVGGSLLRRNGSSDLVLARLYPDGRVDPTFAPILEPLSRSSSVNAIQIQPDGKILVAGSFTNINGTPRNGLARLYPDGSLDLSFSADINRYGEISSIVLKPDCKILVAGTFTAIGGVPRAGIAQLHGGAGKAPHVETPPASQTFSEGQSASLYVQASGCPAPSFQWLFNGKIVDQATLPRLGFDPVRRSDSGEYSLVISNALGVVTSGVARVTVQPAPTHAGALAPEAVSSFGVNGSVRCVLVQDDGRLLIGGSFTSVQGAARRGIARLNEDGSVDTSFDPGLGVTDVALASVNALALQQDGRVVIGGAFQSVDGLGRTNVARLNADGTVDQTFNAGIGPDKAVYALALQKDGRVLMGGAFTAVGKRSRPGLARLNRDGSLDESFSSPYNIRAYAMVPTRAGDIMMGGVSGVGLNPEGFVASVSSNGTWRPVAVSASGPIYAMALLPDETLVVGGQFSSIGGVARSRVARLTLNGAVLAKGWESAALSGAVRALLPLNCGKLVLGGSFTNVGGIRQAGLACLLPDGQRDPTYSEGLEADGTVFGLAPQHDGRILVGGEFSRVSGQARYGLARLISEPIHTPVILPPPMFGQVVPGGLKITLSAVNDCWPPATFQWQFNGTNVPGATNALLVIPNFRLATAGDYRLTISNASGYATSAPLFVGVNQSLISGALDLDFDPMPLTTRAITPIVSYQDGRLLIAFPIVNNSGAILNWKVIRLHPDGRPDPTFTPIDLPGEIRAIAIQSDGRVLIGGTFPGGLARWNANGTYGADSFTGQFRGPGAMSVEALALDPEGRILVGGQFAFHGDFPIPGIARLLPSGMFDTSFDAGSGSNNIVYGLAQLPTGQIIVVGSFAPSTDNPKTLVARLNSDGSLDARFNVGANVQASGLPCCVALLANGKVLVGGQAQFELNGDHRRRLVRLNSDGVIDWSFNAEFTAPDTLSAFIVQLDNHILVAGRFVCGDGVICRILRLHEDGSHDQEFDLAPGTDGAVTALLQQRDGRALMGGSFTKVNGIPRPGLARLLGDIFLFDPSVSENTGGWSVSIATVAGQTYTLESTDSIEHPEWISRNRSAGDGLVKKLTDPTPASSRRYYRVLVE